MTPQTADDRLNTSSMDSPGTGPGPVAATGSPAASATSSVEGRLSFARALRAELMKIRVLRSSWWLSAIALVLVVGFTGLTLLSFNAMRSMQEQGMPDGAQMPEQSDADLMRQLLTNGTGGLAFAGILLGCVGIIAISSEFGTGSIRSSANAVPRRGLFAAAKLTAVAITAAVVGAVLIIASTAIILAFAAGEGLLGAADSGEVWQSALTNWLSMIIVTLLACGLGLLLRSTAGAIVTLTMFLFVVQIALGILSGMTQNAEFVEFLATWEFGNLLSSLTQLREPTGEAYDLSVSTGTAIVGLLAWLAAVIVPATVLFQKRDV
ncbi:ABC transporter permease subunit [Nesterenkonia sp. F]|uniref:ABC transporter permease subunit n=1 Tax=Nesterenkonia sp. F TaxID=795955 RepID=UPI000255D3AF|nr:ABC transporter permease subunit [Nesterenkonia sp. F]